MPGGNMIQDLKRLFRLTPEMLNKYAPYVLFLEVICAWYYGTTEVLPYLYANWGDRVILIHQVFACFIVGQMFVNWICLRFVDSAYIPDVHGSMPQSILLSPDFNISTSTYLTSRSVRFHNVGGEMIKEPNQNMTNGESQHMYWSWSPCRLCDKPRPPRCHHCILCNKCVLKRDHHCFFARNCIGFRNYRHFAVFNFWACITSFYGALHGGVYGMMAVIPYTSYIDILPFYAFIRNLFGYGHVWVGILVLIQWLIMLFCILTFSQLFVSIYVIISGRTTFENDNEIKVIDKRNIDQKIRATFGKYWALNFIFPMHIVFKEEEDPVYWPTISGIESDDFMETSTL